MIYCLFYYYNIFDYNNKIITEIIIHLNVICYSWKTERDRLIMEQTV